MYVIVNRTKQPITKIDPDEPDVKENFELDLPLIGKVSLTVFILILVAILLVLIAIIVGIVYWTNPKPKLNVLPAPAAPVVPAPARAAGSVAARPLRGKAKKKTSKGRARK